MAQRFLDYRHEIVLCAALVAIEEFLILDGKKISLLSGMGTLIVGNGYFKATYPQLQAS